ncbi:DUF1572 domain-containing protein [Psychroserpens sp. SPM9]|uniref:DUF1572 domain-containing protein n=1 Tax=Psychroserpens sp. SPM9 TaxID=2975598 RepID=UPI0021A62C87|nr:DUF1572 domain-containing protein [Psychroserpens sp. SPM9]MDG5491739.1 DUF1572 domain-containing protein [Psychroserpens sp. SPM9]
MQKTSILANRLKEVLLDGLWIANTNYKTQLTNLDWKVATTQVDNLNTIAILAQHVHYYVNGVKNVFEGGTLDIRDQFSFDFPPMASQTAWTTFLTRFWEDSERLIDLVRQLSETQLYEPFVDIKYGSYERNIDGLIEHAYYHLGQISLIKKMLLK